jgi:hypothetical protein
MPPPLDLSGKRFGRLKAVQLLKQRDRQGRRVWRCECSCGATADVPVLSLRTGHTRSCGCLDRERKRRGRPFTKKAARQAHDDAEEIVDGADVWLAPRAACKLLRRSYSTLVKWAPACLAIGGEEIRTTERKSAYDRTITYYLKADLDRVRAALAARRPVQEYPGLVYVFDAARELAVSVRTLRRMQKAYGEGARTVVRPGKSADGRSLPRRYVPREFVDACKPERRSVHVPGGKMTVKQAAARLGVEVMEVHNLIAAGLLAAEKGKDVKAITVAEARAGGMKLRYPRRCVLVPLAAVERLKDAMAAQSATVSDGRRPGRPAGLLRRAAEALRNAHDSMKEANDRAPPPASAAPVQASEGEQARGSKYPGHRRMTQTRGPQPDEARETVLEFCYDEYIVKGRPQGEVLQEARRFGSRYMPKTTMHVRAFARQWASRWEPSLPLDRSELLGCGGTS